MLARVEALSERAIAAAVTRIEAWLPVDSVASPRRETQERLDRIALGQLLQGNVVAHLEDGSFMVEVADMRLRMQLPAETRVGQKINLSLQSRSPQPGFQIETNPQTGVSSAGPSSTAPPGTKQSLPPSTQTIKQTTTSLSSGARLIDNLLLTQREQDGPPVITGKTPVLATPQTPVPQIAEALRQIIEHSGLFYEAHVAAWANGKRPLAALAQEPQQRRKLDTASLAAAQPRSDEAMQCAPAELQSGVSTELAQLVSAQLETLEHDRLIWQGEIWPGQNMVLETARQNIPSGNDRSDSAQPDSEQQEATVWQTSLRIELPQLGAVSARIHLSGERVRIEIEGQGETRQKLRQQQQQLADHIEAAGLGLIALNIADIAAANGPGRPGPVTAQR